jgi:hypothetical protein
MPSMAASHFRGYEVDFKTDALNSFQVSCRCWYEILITATWGLYGLLIGQYSNPAGTP